MGDSSLSTPAKIAAGITGAAALAGTAYAGYKALKKESVEPSSSADTKESSKRYHKNTPKKNRKSRKDDSDVLVWIVIVVVGICFLIGCVCVIGASQSKKNGRNLGFAQEFIQNHDDMVVEFEGDDLV